MADLSQCPKPALAAGDELHGFKIRKVSPLPELRATAYEAVHHKTGAKVLHLHCDDAENLYAITFRTPPADSTGVAHILEHSVLAGSKNYPVKDAFNHLSRSSLNTFINAFTAPDFTCYPICSQVRADFYNLASVYTDLVLRPRLERNTFLREGHHLELNEKGDLAITGIVYNEMKGAYSTPERISHSATLQGLFPDTPYGVESGGRPDCIPDLTYENFCSFHKQYYSPSNARFFLYGNIPTRDHLEFLAGQLRDFDPVDVDSSVKDQPRWSAPRNVTRPFPVGAEDSLEKKSTVNVAWLTAPASDLKERLTLEILEQALMGNAAAPLRKAMIDSGLGEDLSPASGLITWYKELPFIVGLRGTDPAEAEQIERLALTTLEKIAAEGISHGLLEAAFHQVEFGGLEITRSPYPFSITLLFRGLNTWLHDNDPLIPLSFGAHISALRGKWEADPDHFRKAVKRWLVDNPHRLRAMAEPSRSLASEQEEKLNRELAERKGKMTAGELEKIREAAEALLEDQRVEDSPEALATLPRLRVEDIPKKVETIPTVERSINGIRVLEHHLFSNSIVYLDVVFDISDIPEDLQIYLPLLGAASTGMGAAGMNYETFATRKALVTGGVTADCLAGTRLGDQTPVESFVLRAKALERNIPAMVDIIRDILISGDLEDAARLKDIVSQERNQLRAAVAPQGHIFSWRTAAAGLSREGRRDEQWHGAVQLRHLGGLVQSYDEQKGDIREKLSRLRKWVFQSNRMMINLTGDGSCLAAVSKAVDAMIAAMPAGDRAGDAAGPAMSPQLKPARPGVAIPGEVCYVSRVIDVPRYTDKTAPALWVLASHLRTGFLYKKIRVEGGAYGGLSVYDPLKGQFVMLSYRDPNLEKTIDVYDASIKAFLEEDMTPESLSTTIIGAIGRLDRPMDPAAKGMEALLRLQLGLGDADRQSFRDNVLRTDLETLRGGAVQCLVEGMKTAPEAVYAPRERIEEANRSLSRPFEIMTIE
ncbi:MAG: insulinase family protein [Candidatus Eisenbacteria bacterium]|uniref:Insulinase family protein n=1 Tax=Eiseniibacteriota bacterium TaxID=2212470 RepID=A0A948RUZ0_UNCEI|nr:insulinase family protein [Candidatus Eisenbacteria bacterium]MBU1949187.1 insulinase family protein [Candidatus Eisenbacteria bacterium]MBU2691490.1 insulinase family protein [Candidatus Eisenbacteria bacterium]